MAAGGQWNHSFLHITDILPTFLEVAGANYPTTLVGKSVRQPIGKSIMPILSGPADTIAEHTGVGYELFEMKAFLRDDWKLLRLPEPFGTGGWQLYNLAKDPGEIHDLSDEHPDVKAALIEAWQRYSEENDVYDHKGRFDALYRKAFGAR